MERFRTNDLSEISLGNELASWSAHLAYEFAEGMVIAIITQMNGSPAVHLNEESIAAVLTNLLKQYESHVYITIAHLVIMRNRRTEILLERVRLNADKSEVEYCLAPSSSRDEYLWSWCMQLAVYALPVSDRPVCCATCVFSKLPRFGGADDRHGLYCFRDSAELYDSLEFESDYDVWRHSSHPDVDSFYRCDRYEYREAPI